MQVLSEMTCLKPRQVL